MSRFIKLHENTIDLDEIVAVNADLKKRTLVILLKNNSKMTLHYRFKHCLEYAYNFVLHGLNIQDEEPDNEYELEVEMKKDSLENFDDYLRVNFLEDDELSVKELLEMIENFQNSIA